MSTYVPLVGPYFTHEFCRGPSTWGWNERSLYNICAALRGPDNDHEEPLQVLKNHLTTRLRSILFAYRNIAGTNLSTPLEQTFVDEIAVAMRDISTEQKLLAGHFLAHLRTALRETRHHHVWGGYALTVVALICPDKKDKP